MSLAIPVYILAGGRSSRFGSDKARADLHGTPMIQRLSAILLPVAESVTVVAERPHKYRDLGLMTIADEIPMIGPVGGLITALRHRQTGRGAGWLLLSACDWAGARTTWVEELAAAADDGFDAVAFRDDRWQPLFALYHTRLIPEALRLARRRHRRMSDLLDRVSARALPPPQGWHMKGQINTRVEWQRYMSSCTAALPQGASSTSGAHQGDRI